MKTYLYSIGLFFLLGSLTACGGSEEKDENTEAVPADKTDSNEEDMPQEMFNTVVDGRLQVTMDNVGNTPDTAAASISGYIDARHADVAAKDMKLLLRTTQTDLNKPKKHHENYQLSIEEDGRVPGTWVGPHSTCDFTLIAAKDTFRFSTKVDIALYRFKLQFLTAN